MSITSRSGKKSAASKTSLGAAAVAQKAGVSLMTVSRVFNDSPMVAAKTRDRVMEAAQKIGYQPNAAARALRTGRTQTVGYVMSNKYAAKAEFHANMIVSMESMLSSRGLGVMVSIPTGAESPIRRASQLIHSSLCGSLVVQADRVGEADLEELKGLGVPVILCNFGDAKAAARYGLSSVGFNSLLGIQQAVHHLATLRHHRIGFLGGTPGWIDAEERLSAFRQAMGECGLPVDDRWVRACEFDDGYRTGAQGLAHILGQTMSGPTAVICANDEIAAGALAAARGWDKEVPRDLSIVGFDDSRWCDYSTPRLTSIERDAWQLGQSVGKLFLELSEKPSADHRNILLETRLNVRNSTGPTAEVA